MASTRVRRRKLESNRYVSKSRLGETGSDERQFIWTHGSGVCHPAGVLHHGFDQRSGWIEQHVSGWIRFASPILLGALTACGGLATETPPEGVLLAEFDEIELTFAGGSFAVLPPPGGACDITTFLNRLRFDRGMSRLSFDRCLGSSEEASRLEFGSRELTDAEVQQVASAYAAVEPLASIGCGTDAPLILLDVETTHGLGRYVSVSNQCLATDRTPVADGAALGLLDVLDRLRR